MTCGNDKVHFTFGHSSFTSVALELTSPFCCYGLVRKVTSKRVTYMQYVPTIQNNVNDLKDEQLESKGPFSTYVYKTHYAS